MLVASVSGLSRSSCHSWKDHPSSTNVILTAQGGHALEGTARGRRRALGLETPAACGPQHRAPRGVPEALMIISQSGDGTKRSFRRCGMSELVFCPQRGP